MAAVAAAAAAAAADAVESDDERMEPAEAYAILHDCHLILTSGSGAFMWGSLKPAVKFIRALVRMWDAGVSLETLRTIIHCRSPAEYCNAGPFTHFINNFRHIVRCLLYITVHDACPLCDEKNDVLSQMATSDCVPMPEFGLQMVRSCNAELVSLGGGRVGREEDDQTRRDARFIADKLSGNKRVASFLSALSLPEGSPPQVSHIYLANAFRWNLDPRGSAYSQMAVPAPAFNLSSELRMQLLPDPSNVYKLPQPNVRTAPLRRLVRLFDKNFYEVEELLTLRRKRARDEADEEALPPAKRVKTEQQQ
jgi:hypothetical protein